MSPVVDVPVVVVVPEAQVADVVVVAVVVPTLLHLNHLHSARNKHTPSAQFQLVVGSVHLGEKPFLPVP